MLNQGIRTSISLWSSSVRVVPMKLGASGKQKWRIVMDYHKLKLTTDDKYPLQNISNPSDLLDQLGRCEYFTILSTAFIKLK